MKYILDHDLHIHSKISQCSSDPEQTAENILKYAKSLGLKEIALTDHFWDESVPGASNWYEQYHKFSNLAKALPLPKDDEVNFLFGCETDMDKNGIIGLSRDKFDAFDFIIVATTHLHMKGFSINEEDYAKPDKLAKLWVERFDTLIDSDLPFGKVGIAHLSTPCIAYENDLYIDVVKMLPDREMYRLFDKAAKIGLGIELNASDMGGTDEVLATLMHPFAIAKECGCKFYYGSDAHKPHAFEVHKNFHRVVDMLSLTEDDKFIIRK